MPITAQASVWGEEIYFSVPVYAKKEADARDIVQAGELAYWVEGNAIAIGFGRTPISKSDEIRLAAKTNIWGRTKDDVKQLKAVAAGTAIRIEAID